jgi:hypothetical protein
MSQDGSFVGAFNLSTQAGVAAVLAAIRASQLSQSEKNELRDLVFTYTNGGGDASVRIALEQKLAAHSITPVVPQRGGVAAPALSFGTYRPTPNFKSPAATAPSTTSAPQPSLTAPVGQADTTPVSAPIQQATAPVPPPLPIQPTSAPVPPPPAPVAAPVPPAPPVQAAPAPVSPTPAPAPTSGAGQPEAVYLERIRQIKTEVNSKVGNPVNLVDINNAVGREYMNALLEAMKKLGSGAVSEMGGAMQRLESAFAAVQVAIKEHEAKGGASPVVAAASSVPPAPTPVPPPAPVAAPVPPAPPVQAAPAPVPRTTLPVSEFQPPVAEEKPVPPPAPPKPEVSVSNNDLSAARIPLVDVPLPAKAAVPLSDTNSKDENSGPSGYDAVPPKPTEPAQTQNNNVPSSLATERKLMTPNDLPDPASVETGEKGDPLFTKEVDAGLDQLLADWSLFKKSGLFGTGPKGREHPLYKKISSLQVPLLLAGRFDGANQEIRQSITDYMNGWRYEQGIIYQPGETFERYLRRVIKHILDLQKKRRGA